MGKEEPAYIAIDLKSFYASVECRERGLDPMTTNLVVADVNRTEKTICLAVSPSLKACGISGRPRLFQVMEQVKKVNMDRREKAPGRCFRDISWDAEALKADPSLELSYLIATPRMALYMKYSTEIYGVYLKYIAPEDIHVYSIDEVMIDASRYQNLYGMTARQLASVMIRDVQETTGITAAAGIGTNLYLCKVAMDIGAKHAAPDANGVRIAQLDERSYRRLLWGYRPLTDFWRVGRGYARKLEEVGLYTMGDIARCSLGKPSDYYNEDLLYRMFGINAQLLIDHAWGWEPCTMADIKAYRPKNNSLVAGQVLSRPYTWEEARLVAKEMADSLALDLTGKKLVTAQLVLTEGYDMENLQRGGTWEGQTRKEYEGEITLDRYGRDVPKHGHGTIHLSRPTSSSGEIMKAVLKLFDREVDPKLLVRRLAIAAEGVKGEEEQLGTWEQLELFGQEQSDRKRDEEKEQRLEREKRLQEAVLEMKQKFGKNAVLKGMSLEEGATARERNRQIGGHRA